MPLRADEVLGPELLAAASFLRKPRVEWHSWNSVVDIQELHRHSRGAWAKLTPADRRTITLKRFTEFVNEQFSCSYNPDDLMAILEQLRVDPYENM
jgi:hypothetical protein